MLDELREQVLAANVALVTHRLVKLTWGNVSGVDRASGVMAIKASGGASESMTADDVVLIDLADGTAVEGTRRPSTDTPTHLALYRAFGAIGGVGPTPPARGTA